MKYGNYGRLGKRFKLFESPITLVVGLCVLVVLTKATWSIHQKVLASAAKLEQARAELDKLKTREADLSKQVSYLSSEGGIEAELRTKYRAVKEGESVAVIVDDGHQTATIENATSSDTTSWWHSILNWFGL